MTNLVICGLFFRLFVSCVFCVYVYVYECVTEKCKCVAFIPSGVEGCLLSA